MSSRDSAENKFEFLDDPDTVHLKSFHAACLKQDVGGNGVLGVFYPMSQGPIVSSV